jgi:hypothetical protein
MNLNFGLIQRVRSTVRKALKAVAAARLSLEESDKSWREAFFVMLKALRPWPEARMAITDVLRAHRDAALR